MPRGAALWTGEQPRAACLLLGPAQTGLHPIVFTGIDCRYPTTVLWCSLSYCAPLISSRGPRRPASSSVLLLFPWRASSLNSLRCSERCVFVRFVIVVAPFTHALVPARSHTQNESAVLKEAELWYLWAQRFLTSWSLCARIRTHFWNPAYQFHHPPIEIA